MAKKNDMVSKITARRPGHAGSSSIASRPVERSKDFKGTAKKLVRYLKPYYGGIAVVLGFALSSTIFSIFGPIVLGKAVDMLFSGFMDKMNDVPNAAIDFHSIIRILSLLLVIYVISALFSYIQEYLMAGISQRFIRQMRNDVSKKLQHLPLKFFDNKTHGEILSRVTNDIDTISGTAQESFVQIITSITVLMGITIMMLTISPIMSLITFFSLPMSVFITGFIAKRSQKYFIGQQRELGELNGHVEEMYGGHSVIKAFNYEQHSLRIFNETNNELYKHGWKAQFATSVILPILNFVGNFTYIGICVLGGFLTATGRMSLGSVQAFISYSRQFSQPISQVSGIVNVLQSTIAAAERVFEILEEPEEIPNPENPLIVESPKGQVDFNHIDFRYIPEKPLLEDVNIHVKPGQLVAIVGPTGAGKTTLVNLLMRFYELDSGSIEVDGIKTTQMKRKDLHSLLGMVLQDTWLFKGTIYDNIAYGKRGATEEEVIYAATVALADGFIRTFPDGYQTIINEEANNISQGQKQLITIARAIVAQPPIMILDEATSSVDTRTEVLIQRAMKRLMSERTSFVIAHRLSTIREADCILVMKEGAIVEQGTHHELLDQNGFYAELYNSQFVSNDLN